MVQRTRVPLGLQLRRTWQKAALLLALASVLLVGTEAWAGLRTLFAPSANVVSNRDSDQDRAAKAALAKGNVTEARRLWRELAESYAARNKLQEAAWTYRQAGEMRKAEEITAKLESILATANVVGMKPVGEGVTAAVKVTFDNGMSAIFKTIDFKTEIGAYRVDRVLNLNLVASTVSRVLNGTAGSMQIWIEDAVAAGKTEYALPDFGSSLTTSDLFFLDELLGNADRHSGNFLVRAGNHIVAIDHGRTFGWSGTDFLPRIAVSAAIPRRDVYERLLLIENGQIDASALLGDILTPKQIQFFLRKTKSRVEEIRRLITAHGETVVFEGMDPYISGTHVLSELAERVAAKDWKGVAETIAKDPMSGFHVLKLMKDQNVKNAEIVASAIGLSLFAKGKISGAAALGFARYVFLHVTSAEDGPKADAQAKLWLKNGPPGTIELVLQSPWLRKRLETDVVWLEAVLDGETKRNSLMSSWERLHPLAIELTKKNPEAARRIAERLPAGSDAQKSWVHAAMLEPQTARAVLASANTHVHDSILTQFYAQRPYVPVRDHHPEDFLSYLEANRSKITAAALGDFLVNPPEFLFYPALLAKLVDLFPGEEYRDTFAQRIPNLVFGESRARLLKALTDPANPNLTKAFDALTLDRGAAESQLSSGALAVVGAGRETTAIESVTVLGEVGFRLSSGTGTATRTYDVFAKSPRDHQELKRLLRVANGVRLRLPSSHESDSSRTRFVNSCDLRFVLPDGSEMGWKDLLADFARPKSWSEKLKSDEAVREARWEALEVRFGASQTKLNKWPFAKKTNSCRAALFN